MGPPPLGATAKNKPQLPGARDVCLVLMGQVGTGHGQRRTGHRSFGALDCSLVSLAGIKLTVLLRHRL